MKNKRSLQKMGGNSKSSPDEGEKLAGQKAKNKHKIVIV